MLWSDVRLGAPFDAAPFASVRLGGLPVLATVVAPAAVIQGVAYVPVPGPQGLPGTVAGTLPYTAITGTPARSYLFPQSSPAATWSVNHNLGFYPSVTIMDSAGSVIYGDVQHISVNQVTLTFSAPFSGQASFS